MNPETYGWYQCDEEDYDSNASLEEQAESAAAQKQYAAELIAGMRAAVAEVLSYCERYQRAAEERRYQAEQDRDEESEAAAAFREMQR